LLAILGGCGAEPQAGRGTSQGARRILSTLPGITEMICHLGARDRLVAVSGRCDYPPSVRGLRHIKVHPLDVEAALLARPDLVVVDVRLHRRDLARIRKRFPAVLELDTSRSLESVAVSMERLAAVLDTPTARARAATWRGRKQALQAKLAADAPRIPPRVLIVGQWDPLYALGPGSLLDDVVRLCGGTNVAADLEGDASGTFNEELVLERRPAWILRPLAPVPERIRRRWQDVPAMRDGHVVDASADDLVRAGPRILDAVERLRADGFLAPAGTDR
jgi:ABC-type Fe3+-hydroxamate transport system substrate-binding protein